MVTEEGKVLANVRDIYAPKVGGIHPSEAAEHHKKVAAQTIEKALNEAKIKLENIDVICFSQGPGMPPALRVGRDIALELVRKTKKPLVGVSHIIGHIEIGRLTTKAKDPVILYVSGGNSIVIAFAEGKYRPMGETLDIAIGNAIDKFARNVGLGFPGGPLVEEMAKGGKYVELPYTVKGMDFAFSGLVTAATKLHNDKKASVKDLSFSFQETAFAMLTEVVERALAHTGKNEVLLTGGVAANKRLQEMLDVMCKERGAKFYVVPREYSGDNGAMIAWTGLLEWQALKKETKDTDIKPRWRTDEVEIRWL